MCHDSCVGVIELDVVIFVFAQFQEKEKKMRQLSKSVLSESKSESKEDLRRDFKYDESSGSKTENEYGIAYGLVESTGASYGIGEEEAKAQSKSSNVNNTKAVVASKPAWALTEKEADEKIEGLELEEENDLIEFAKNLDFDKYISDLEVKAVMEKLRRRISDLEREVAQDEQRTMDVDARAMLRAKLEEMVSCWYLCLCSLAYLFYFTSCAMS